MTHRNDPDRYTVSAADNAELQFVDEAQEVLANKKGITDVQELQRQEERALVKAYDMLLAEVRTDTPLTCELIRHIHLRIFGELYTWAGRWRTVNISKPGVAWPPPNHLEQAMYDFEQDILSVYPPDALHEDDAFCRAAAHIQGEFLAIHPFREGNARTIKLCTNLLAVQSDRPILLYDATTRGRGHYIEAAKAAILKDYTPMEQIIRTALSESRQYLL